MLLKEASTLRLQSSNCNPPNVSLCASPSAVRADGQHCCSPVHPTPQLCEEARIILIPGGQGMVNNQLPLLATLPAAQSPQVNHMHLLLKRVGRAEYDFQRVVTGDAFPCGPLELCQIVFLLKRKATLLTIDAASTSLLEAVC